MKALCIVGARPNFMKVTPVLEALGAGGHDARLIHTGQHYDENMSRIFFQDLTIPEPDVNLGVGSGSHAQQTARVMETFEPVLLAAGADLVLVAGDVNSTLACALVAVKVGVTVAHLEAGLRSFDRTMPEEINRLLTDQIADILLTPSPEADANLLREGLPKERIFRVGNAMIDSLDKHLPAARARTATLCGRLGLEPGGYGVVTLHRAANVDDSQRRAGLLEAIGQIAGRLPLVFPVHPRARDRIAALEGLHLIDPLGYLDFLALQAAAKLVLTDSGGIQEETTVLGVPCLTLRQNTERPITVSEGTNQVVGVETDAIVEAAARILDGDRKAGARPALWDGKTGARVVEVLEAFRLASA